MKLLSCPHCPQSSEIFSLRPKTRRIGRFYRKSDRKWIQRFLCDRCGRSFSRASFDLNRYQNKRHLNDSIELLLCSGISLRRIALLLNLSRTTVSRKLIFLGAQARIKFETSRSCLKDLNQIQFDDLETSEHTKCKPLSVTLAVEAGSRRILGFEVAPMAAKGKLARIALKKYGKRADLRKQSRLKLFADLKEFTASTADFLSDKNPHYLEDLRKVFPECTHRTTEGKRGCVVGQGELKRGGFDPLFSLNHTCAMLRANINRLFRRTWCTTKKRERLIDHLFLYANFHNEILI